MSRSANYRFRSRGWGAKLADLVDTLVDCVREMYFRPFLDQPCGWPRQRLVGQAAYGNVLGPFVRVALDQDFVRRQFEMTVRQMHGEAGQFAFGGIVSEIFSAGAQILSIGTSLTDET